MFDIFGYVIANADQLTDEQKTHYRACYCGLCSALGERHGTLSRLTLTYDMTFLVLLLSAVSDTEYPKKDIRCLPHPLKTHPMWRNQMTDYAADMNVALVYYNALDDWHDDKSVVKLAESKALSKQFHRIEQEYPAQCTKISECLSALSKCETEDEQNPDLPANCFGALMGELFAYSDNEETKKALGAFGFALGKFIYIMDAVMDLKEDLKKQQYNPLVMVPREEHKQILTLLMAECMNAFNRLPVRRDKELMENILYSGVWTQYEHRFEKKGGEPA